MIFDPTTSPFEHNRLVDLMFVAPDNIGWTKTPQHGDKTWVTPNGTIFTFPEGEPEMVWVYQGGTQRSAKSKVSTANRAKPATPKSSRVA